MQVSIVNYSKVISLFDFRIDAEYWHPFFIKNSKLVSPHLKIGDFVKNNILNIKLFPISRDFDYLEISNISLSNYQYQTNIIHEGEEPDRATYMLQKKDVAVSTVRPNRNAVAFIEKHGIIGSSGLSILRANNIEPEYLAVFCKTNYFIKCLMRANKATMYPAVSNNDILNTPIFVASYELKRLIVKLFNNAFEKNKKSRKEYNQAQNLLLTELGLINWQPKHRLTFIKNHSDTKQARRIDAEYYQPKYEGIIKAIKNYPGGWITLGNLVTIKKCVEVGSDEYLDSGIPFVRVSNITPFEISEEKYISENLYAEINQHQPGKGEILFSKDATPGVAYYLDKEPRKMIPSGGILRLKNKTDKVNNEYLTLILNSVLTQEQINRDVGGSVILHWRPNQVKETIIPILPKIKQTQIKQKITESFNLRKQSKHLLECAKRAVEIAIEQDEQTAMAWLKNATDKM